MRFLKNLKAVGIGFAFAVLLLVGCRTKLPSVYVAPRITGRVVDAQTQQPIADVRVKRVQSDENLRAMEPTKGAQRMDQLQTVRTDADGKFTLNSVRDVALMRKMGWYAVSISFDAPRYDRLITTYTITNAVLNTRGEPEVCAGDIKLSPTAK